MIQLFSVYDMNRVTDVLLNDAHPTKEELEQEENGVENMSDQEKNLYKLLKKIAELRENNTDSNEKIKVFERDIEELISKNNHLQEVEQVKNEIQLALDHEKKRAIDLEAMCTEKTHAFQSVIEEKEKLHEDLAKIQAEKDELKGTLDTLHKLRDQEEEEIEKTLDEAKSIIQKLEEKLHNKDDKIRRYKEKISLIERDKAEVEGKIMGLEDEFKDKEKNMKLKLLWAQMEKKDLATTLLKLENSAHHIHQSEFKSREHTHPGNASMNLRRNSQSEEKT